MPKYIKCESLVEDVWASMENNPHADEAISLNHEHEHRHFLHLIAKQPAADVAPVIPGEWICAPEPDKMYLVCSVCGQRMPFVPEYLPDLPPYCNCGAKMDGGVNNKTD
ncbi:MAG: hypothetical protein ACI4TK_19415 [Agathobacter sp.]